MKIKSSKTGEIEINEDYEKELNNNQNRFNKSDNYELYKIPYKENEYDLIKKIHENCNHRN